MHSVIDAGVDVKLIVPSGYIVIYVYNLLLWTDLAALGCHPSKK